MKPVTIEDKEYLCPRLENPHTVSGRELTFENSTLMQTGEIGERGWPVKAHSAECPGCKMMYPLAWFKKK